MCTLLTQRETQMARVLQALRVTHQVHTAITSKRMTHEEPCQARSVNTRHEAHVNLCAAFVEKTAHEDYITTCATHVLIKLKALALLHVSRSNVIESKAHALTRTARVGCLKIMNPFIG